MKKITLLIVLFAFAGMVHAQITTYPYQEDFESGDGGWTADNSSAGSWELGEPAADVINSADSGINAWVTNLTGNYNPDDSGIVNSPIFDFSSLNAPSIQLSIWYNSEFSWDGMVLQSSIDDGASWQNVGAVDDPNNWYTDDTINGSPGGQEEGWSGSGDFSGSGGWVVARNALAGLGGQPNVILRFAFGADDFVQLEGIGFDTISIFEVLCPEPTAIALDALNENSATLSWTAGDTETQWEILNQESGLPAPTATDSGTTTNDNPYLVEGLIEGTNYDFYVRADCGGSGTSAWVGPFSYRVSGPGEVCENSILVTTPLPYIVTDDTANYQDDYNGIPGEDCGSDFSYLNGDDVVYAYTPDADTSIDIELSALSSTYAGVFVYSSCENIGTACETGAVNGFSSEDLLIDNFAVVAGQTYYIVISTWAPPESVGYTLTITENTCVDPQATFNVVSDCIVGPQFFVEVDITDLGSATSLTVSDDQGSDPIVVSELGSISFGPYPNETNIVITVVNNDDANCILNSNPLVQNFCTDSIVDCDEGPVNTSFCYFNDIDDDPSVATFLYTSSNGLPLNLTFNQGQLEGCCDELVVLDTNGDELFNENLTDVSGLTFQSTGESISWYINSDFSISCESSGDYTPFDVTVACATCINPAATYQIVDDCDAGEQFLINVNVTSLGDATSLTISNNINGDTTPVTETGTYLIGPFPFLTDVFVTISNDQDINCVINSNAIQLAACPPENDNPCDATDVPVNEDETCNLFVSGTLLEATPSGVEGGTCTGNTDDDVWFQFTATSELNIIQFNNIDSSGFFENLDHAVYSGSCDDLLELYCSPDDASLTPNLTIGETYFIRVFSFGDVPVDYTFDLCIRPSIGNVSVDQTTYTPEELVTDILIGLECAEITNITFSTGTNFGEENGIGYFTAEEGSFPFTEGLLLTTGDASEAAGPNFTAMTSGTTAWPGDEDLDNIIPDGDTNNATIIEFDFVSYADEISFDFLMASEEYAQNSFECNFSDAFAFLLTDADGITTNLAVLPGTTTPILVTNIHPANDTCGAINEEFFGGYTPENLPPTSFDGRTTVFTAMAPTVIGDTYHIKLVIADEGDSAFDSGVFLRAGSFDIGEIDLGTDITIENENAICNDEPIILSTEAEGVTHVWYKDLFVIEGESTNILEVTEEGDYFVQIIFSPTCIIEDGITVEFLPLPEIETEAIDIFVCSVNEFESFNLNDNDVVILGDLNPEEFTITYHDSEEDADDGIDALTSPYTNTSNPQTIYARVVNNITNCDITTEFNIATEPPTHTATSASITECDNDGDGFSDFDLDANTVNVLDGQDPSQFIVTYHSSQEDANSGEADLVSPYESNGETVFVRVESISNEQCYVTNSFELIFGLEPISSFTEDFDYEVCPDATSPITIEATPVNYELSEVSIQWFRDGQPEAISGANGLTLDVLEGDIYSIAVTFNDTGCIGEQEIEIITLESCVIPQGISPGNNDGKNDTFDLGNFRVSKIEIFNRYGTQVYEKTNYVDEWFGQDMDGNELPVGTYFYSILFDDGERNTGWVYIQREN